MLGKLIPVIMLILGVGGGVGAGLALKPKADQEMAEHAVEDQEHAVEAKEKPEKKEEKHADEADHGDAAVHEYVKINNQFLVPVVSDELVESLVVLSLSIEVMAGQTEAVYSREPKLRDAFLQVLFDHANIGGFRGEFTSAKNLEILRGALTEVAQKIVGDVVDGVLITDIARQDV